MVAIEAGVIFFEEVGTKEDAARDPLSWCL